jgi:hypothetical protein
MYDIARIIVEVVSAIICFILAKFMTKPYSLSGEARYLGLPLGFGFLGISYVIAAFAYSQLYFTSELFWVQFLSRTFAFVFLATTYYFSKKRSKNTRLLWDITLSLLTVALIVLFLMGIISPQFSRETYQASQVYVRILNVICLSYIAIHTLRSHVKEPDPTTIWIPLGFILLAISQYTLLFWYIDSSLAAFTGALVLRLVALTVFLAVAYLTFYSPRKRTNK